MEKRLTEAQLKQIIRESLEEMVDEGGVDEGRFGNFLSSLGKGIRGTVRGGLDQGRQMYNQNMADRSAADAKNFRSQMNAGYNDIPEAQAIAKKYDGKIGKLKTQLTNLQGQISQLQSQKKQEMQAARTQHKSKMMSQANKFGNTAKNAQTKASDMMNRRRASLGLDPMQQGGQQSMVAESVIDKAIIESIKKYTNKQ